MDIGDKVIKDIGEAYIVLHDRVPELEQELTELKQVEKLYEEQNVRLIKENAKIKKYLEKVYLHIAFEQEVPEGFYDWFDDNGKAL